MKKLLLAAVLSLLVSTAAYADTAKNPRTSVEEQRKLLQERQQKHEDKLRSANPDTSILYDEEAERQRRQQESQAKRDAAEAKKDVREEEIRDERGDAQSQRNGASDQSSDNRTDIQEERTTKRPSMLEQRRQEAAARKAAQEEKLRRARNGGKEETTSVCEGETACTQETPPTQAPAPQYNR